MNIFLIGCAKIGLELIPQLLNEGHHITVVAESHDLEGLGRDYQLQSVAGNPADEELLVNAGIQKAQAVMCVTADEHQNLMIAQIAKNIHHVPIVMAKINDPKLEQSCRKHSIFSVCPLKIETDYITGLLSKESRPHALLK
jgi:trk system potassium uptake protein TrkA